MKLKAFFLILTQFLIAGRASTPQADALLQDQNSLSEPHQNLLIPFIDQSEKQCGPAVLAMSAAYFHLKVSFEELSQMIFTPAKQGSFTSDFLAAARRLGLVAVETHRLRALFEEVKAEHPVAVLLNLGTERNPIWHYALLTGYDLGKRKVILHSGHVAHQTMHLDQFERAWNKASNWALVMTQNSSLPVTSTVTELIYAASALEKTKHPETAQKIYETLLSKDPSLVSAWFGLANTRTALQDESGAIDALEKASLLAPENPAIWNNLSEVYQLQGFIIKSKQALKNAEKLKK